MTGDLPNTYMHLNARILYTRINFDRPQRILIIDFGLSGQS